MEVMNTFQRLWKNWISRPYNQPDVNEHVWINELNQAVFKRLENILEPYVRVRTVDMPSFIYFESPSIACDDSGMRAAAVSTYRILLPKVGTFEERVDATVDQLVSLIVQPGIRTVFFYTPVVPICADDFDGGPNRHHMCVRLTTTGETVDKDHER